MAGLVRVAGEVRDKPGTLVEDSVPVEVSADPCPYASRGGLKLEAALDAFAIDPRGRAALDIGASTGGFTDCLLQRGAARVIAVDVGYGQLAWHLRRDPRVVVLERRNARYLQPEDLPVVPDLATVDVSFISLRLILPAILRVVRPGSDVIALVKPQFEAGRGEVGKGGVVRDERVRRAAVEGVARFASATGFSVCGECESPLAGPKGNREVFLWLRVTGAGSPAGVEPASR